MEKKRKRPSVLDVESRKKRLYGKHVGDACICTLYVKLRYMKEKEDVLQLLVPNLKTLCKILMDYVGEKNRTVYKEEITVLSQVVDGHCKRMACLGKEDKWRNNDFREFILLPIKYLGNAMCGLCDLKSFHGILKAALERLGNEYPYGDSDWESNHSFNDEYEEYEGKSKSQAQEEYEEERETNRDAYMTYQFIVWYFEGIGLEYPFNTIEAVHASDINRANKTQNLEHMK